MSKRLILKDKLVRLGHFARWVYVLNASIMKANGFNQLVELTKIYSFYDLSKITFKKSFTSKSMWILNTVIASYEIGLSFK